MSSSRSLCGRSRTPSTCATALRTSCASNTGARSTSQAPSRNRSACAAATSMARRVLPEPPAPVSVTRRASPSSAASSSSSRPRPTKLVSWSGRLWRRASGAAERWEVALQVGVGELEELLRALDVGQPVRPEVAQARAGRQVLPRQLADGARHEDLAAVRERADPGAAVDGHPAPVRRPGIGLAGVQRHADPDLQAPRPVLAFHRALDLERARQGVGRAREHGEGRVALPALLQQRAATCRHGGGDQLLLAPERAGGLARVEGVQPGRALDVGQHERHGAGRGRRWLREQRDGRLGVGAVRAEGAGPDRALEMGAELRQRRRDLAHRLVHRAPHVLARALRLRRRGPVAPAEPYRPGQLARDEVQLLARACGALVVRPLAGLVDLLAQLLDARAGRRPWPARRGPARRRSRRRPSARPPGGRARRPRWRSRARGSRRPGARAGAPGSRAPWRL